MAETNGNEQGSKVVCTYLPVAMVNALEARAQAEDRPLSQVIRRTLRAALSAEVG